MGWCCDDGTHEGYLVGLVFDDSGKFLGPAGYPDRKQGFTSGRMRELGTPEDDHERGPAVKYSKRFEGARPRTKHLGSPTPLNYVKVGCSCGWRSTLIRAWPGTEWSPSAVFAPQSFEDLAGALWSEHVRTSATVYDGGASLHELVRKIGKAAAE